jgi:hypothetical protein
MSAVLCATEVSPSGHVGSRTRLEGDTISMNAGQPRLRAHSPRPTVQPDVETLRRRYSEGLICARCALLLATRRESYAKSGLTEPQRGSYVCAECRADEVAAARAAAARAEAGRANLAAARAARHRAGSCTQGLTESPLPDRKTHAELHDGVSVTPRLTAAACRWRRARRGGRPRTYATRAESNRARQRAFRVRRKVAWLNAASWLRATRAEH